MKTTALVLAVLSILPFTAHAEKLSVDNAKEHYEATMRFTTFKPCDGRSAMCAPRVLAEGVIELESAAKLDQFLKTKTSQADELPAVPTISFDSAGGNLAGALQLGRYIRALKLNTNLESDYMRTSLERSDRSEVFVANARCNESCVFAFAGGIARTVDIEAKMGMQAIPRNAKPVAGIPAADELSIYLRDMGVRSEILNVAALALPGSMVWFSESQLAHARLDNSQPYASPWALADSGKGAPVVNVRQEISNSRTLSLIIGYYEGELALVSSVELSRTLMDDMRLQDFPVNEQARITLRTDKRAISVASMRPWSRSDNGATAIFVAVGKLDDDDARVLASAQSLQLEDAFPKGRADLSGATELSTENLKPSIALLLRSK